MTWQSREHSKKAFKEKAMGKHIADAAFSVSLFGDPTHGTVAVEGPYPVHRWYATVKLSVEGKVVDVK